MTQFSNTIAETQYAKKASQYINILNDLRRIGAHSAVDLPTVVFCGNQSAGKSSLLEAISNVQLPRSEGTCARCVMELRLIELEVEWSCQISLRQEYNGKGKRFSQPTEVKFGSLIKSHKEVELMARRAQKALLNPSKNSDEFLNWNFGTRYNGDDANTNELKFTKNVVCLEIKGKNVPNLSLIDLPGIIHHTEKAEDRKFIDLIKELVKEYIKKEQSIIIATITCRDEIDNQAIVTLAKEADPAGRRTLGVLTKPDTIERGTHDIWLKILRGEAHKLSLGYYVFFESRDPWKDFMSDRIGVKKLRHKLSELLIQAIKRDLPKISKDAGEKLEEALPEKLGENSKIEIYKMVKKCVNKINDETSASSGSHKLWQMINAKFNEFNKNLFLSRPIFVIGKRSTKFDLLKDEVCTPQTLQIHQQISQPISTLNDVPQTPQILQFPQRNSFSYGCQDLEDQEDQEEQKDTLKMITEQQITELIISARGRLLPGFIPYSSAMTIIKDTQFEWKSPSLECLDGIYDIMFNFVHDVINETFSRFPLLHGEMNSKSSFRKRLIEILKGEGSKPTDATDIIASLLAYFKIAFKRYADTIAMTIIHAFIDEFTKRIEEKLVEICVNDDEGFDIGELIQEDHNSQEIWNKMI
ncbi:7611_t:CDS:2 [Diversispora eburnea]|uniref:7611_t:CDS:1 n=1 Tax=Diversispora eburnea TaxID=1213867 RepID=A0A9N9F276_9GLOM|nr:7611_t:CDS:2 [Diversispora eburnea]